MADHTNSSTKIFDIVVFGASGFTGQYVVEYLARVFEEEGGLKWAVAGRSKKKLAAVLEEASKQTGKDLRNMPILEADVSNESSLNTMCQQAQLVLNCVGPYVFYGEKVVKACIDNKAHHVDISGESLFHEKMDLKYHDKAEKAGVYVVEACGFDSVPADIGVLYAKKHFDGELNSIESFVGLQGGGGNFGTYHTVVTLLNPEKGEELKDVRRDLFKERLPKPDYALPARTPISYSTEANGRVLPFFPQDCDIVRRSTRHNYFENKERPIQYRSYIRMPGILACLVAISMGITLKVFSTFRLGRRLLLKYPRLFTLGAFSKNGPARKVIEKSSFIHTMVGRGWGKKLPVGEKHPQGPDKNISFRMIAPDAGYAFTPLAMVESGLTILKETSKLPKTGGVYTPAAAFANTSIIERLQKGGVKFQLLNKL
ncbi:saccharopine dehydrogenase-like oxidoreductase isoform X1 [Lineus longissimus]|uniref:saccharopine dehydrogenase-like oxidoreductase isoform X1 n=2 Tax=Lineus longissimus TaxID=88925 RepID=UPI002B4C7D53